MTTITPTLEEENTRLPATHRAPLITYLCLSANPYLESGDPSDEEIIDFIRKKQLRILLVDDTDDFRDSMRFLLTEVYAAAVMDVNSGKGAVELVSAGEAFNAIFLDLIMPDMNGVDAYKKLRQADAACRIVVMSAYSDSKEWKEIEDLNVELVEKPIPNERLTSILSEL